MTYIYVSVAFLLAVAVADVWVSRLSRGAKVLWSLVIVFLVGVGLVAWLLTRASAYREIESSPTVADGPAD